MSVYFVFGGKKVVTIQSKELQNPLAEGVKRARLTSRPILVSKVLNINPIDPLSFFALGQAEYTGRRVYWSDPAGELVIAGLGAVCTIKTESEQRFAQAQSNWTELLQDHVRVGASAESEVAAGTGPLLLGGFSFDPLQQGSDLWQDFGDGRLMLPQLMVTQTQGNSWLTVNQLVNAGDEPKRIAEQLLLLIKTLFELPLPDLYGAGVYPVAAGSPQVVENEPEKWKEAVAHASREIRAGLLHKVVLARELQVSSELTLSPEIVLTRLREEQPMSYLFAVEIGAGCFLGATPERLVKSENNTLSAACLAG
ncbi:MAG: isochorismate synthase, partial [Bacilli bacterium]|nr:isochorismate synthase [Bacilli bacterium]